MRYSAGFLRTIQFIVAPSLFAASWSDLVTRGSLQYDQGLYRDSIAEYGAALPLAGSPADRAVTLYRLALAHEKLAEFAAAERCYREALTIFRAEGDAARLALSLAGLGETYRAQGHLDEALSTERHALGILKQIGKPETADAAGVFAITGEVLNDQHRLKAARYFTQQALFIQEKTLGPDNPDLATSLNNLGVIAVEQKHAGEAEALLTRALKIREARFGTGHPAVAGTLLSLSSVYLKQKRYAEAGMTCHRALEMMRRFLPASHPDVIRAQIGLALIAHRSGNSSGAIDVLEAVVRSIGDRPAAITAEYAQLLNLYCKYLGDAGEKEKSHRFRLEANQLAAQLARTSPEGATVALGELETGGWQGAGAYQSVGR
jgi:tetratricopeptide (TPR) repeat protein